MRLTGRPKKARARPQPPPPSEPEPPPPPPPPPSQPTAPPPPPPQPQPPPAPVGGDDSLSEAPIIDLIQDVDADGEMDVDAVPPQSEPERTVTVVRPAAPAAPQPAAHSSVKVITTPPYKVSRHAPGC